MPDLTVRPTAKFLKAGAIVAALIFLALEIACVLWWNAAAGSSLIMIAPVFIFPLLALAWPARRWPDA